MVSKTMKSLLFNAAKIVIHIKAFLVIQNGSILNSLINVTPYLKFSEKKNIKVCSQHNCYQKPSSRLIIETY